MSKSKKRKEKQKSKKAKTNSAIQTPHVTPPPQTAKSAISYHGILFYLILSYNSRTNQQTAGCLVFVLSCLVLRNAQNRPLAHFSLPSPVILRNSVMHHEPRTNTITIIRKRRKKREEKKQNKVL